MLESLDTLDPEADGCMFCIKVVQSPLSVVLRCHDDTERKRWLSALQARSAYWTDQRSAELASGGRMAAAGMTSAGSASYLSKNSLSDDVASTASTASTNSLAEKWSSTPVGAFGSEQGSDDDDEETDDVASLS